MEDRHWPNKAVSLLKWATYRKSLLRRVIVGRATRREYQKNPREFDAWVKANTLFGSILAIGMVAMALAGLNSAGPPDAATELSSITGRSEVGAE